MIEMLVRPNRIKDAVGVLLVVATGSLYAAGLADRSPCDCGAVVDDDDDVEAVEAPIDAVSQRVVIVPT